MSGKASNFIQMKEDPKNLGRGISTDNDPTLNYIEFNYSIHEGVSDATLNELTLTAKSINKNYRLDIKASALQDYNIETWDITIEPNIDIFQDIVSTDIQITTSYPVANADKIDNTVGTLRIAAASLENLGRGSAISSDDGLVLLASIMFKLDESKLESIKYDSKSGLLESSIQFTVSANRDQTILSKYYNDESGFHNSEIKSLRDLDGDILSNGTTLDLYRVLFNLDVDGNGRIEAFSDGFMILRKMFGDAFEGDALTDKVLPSDANRNTQEIHDYIQSGIDSGALDVDGSGRVEAFSDGFMILRKMFGDAFEGDALTDKVISSDATRTTGEIHAYIESLMNI